MVTATSALACFFVVVLPYRSCSPAPLDELNINLNIKENNQQKGIGKVDTNKGRDNKKAARTPSEGLGFEYDIHYIGEQLNRPGGNDNNYGSTGSAIGCRELCQKTWGCAWFNWQKPTDTRGDRCWLKRGKGDEIRERPGDVTGPRDFTSELTCPTKHVNLQLRRDEEVLKGIRNALKCAWKCQAKTTCNFWTWAHYDAGEFALDCVLMSDYGSTNPDNNVITGAKSCEVPETIRMNAQCDDSNMKLFADGNLVATRENYVVGQSVEVLIPGNTKMIQIDCENTMGTGGIVASTLDGVLTNNAWQCSSDNGKTWNPAYEIKSNDGWGAHRYESIEDIRPEAKWIWTGKDDWDGKQMAISCKINIGSCFEYDIHRIGDALNKPGMYTNNYGPTGHARGCQLLCQNTNGCAWFNWQKSTGTKTYDDQCFLFRDKGDEIEQHPGDVSGPRSCMQIDMITHYIRAMGNLQANRGQRMNSCAPPGC